MKYAEYGRITAGDAVLKALASYFPLCLLRPDDTAYRLHGDESAVVARTPLKGGIIIAERIRRMAETASPIYFGGFTVYTAQFSLQHQ